MASMCERNVRVGVERGGQLGAGFADRRSIHEHARIGGVDETGLDRSKARHIKTIDGTPGGQQASGFRAAGLA